MAKETIKVVQIDTNPAVKSLKDLRKELLEYKNQMTNLEEGSDAFLEVANKAGEVKHQIDEINESIKGASSDFGDMVGNITNVVAGITGAFQAVAGGLQAMGVESEAIDKTIAKMQGLMAVTQGLSAIDDGIKSFDKLTKSLGKAGETLNGFVKGLGKIAAPVAVITALGVAFVKLKERIDGTSTALKTRETAQKNFNTELERELEIRKQAGYTEEENIQFQIAQLELRNQQLAETNETLQTQNNLVSQNAQAAQSAAGAMGGLVASHAAFEGVAQSSNINVGANTRLIQENTKEINDNAEAISNLKNELDIIGKARELAAKRTTKISSTTTENTIEEDTENLYESFRKSQSKLDKEYSIYLADLENKLLALYEKENKLLNRYIVEKKDISGVSLLTVEENEQTLMGLVEQLEIRTEELEIEKQIAATIERELSTTKESLESYNNVNDLSEEQQQIKQDLIQREQQLTRDLFEQNSVVNDLEQSYGKLATKINELGKDESYKFIYTLDEQLHILMDTMDLFTESSLGISSGFVEGVDKMHYAIMGLLETIKEGGEDSWQGYVSAASMGLQAVGTMLNAASEEVDTNTKEGFEQQKKLQIAATVMNMLSGIMAAWNSAMALPAPASFILGGINTAATAALGAAQIAKIKQTKFDGGGTASASVSNSAVSSTIIPPVQYSSAVQGATTEGAIKDTKVYVTETDIVNTMNKVSVQESENTY